MEETKEMVANTSQFYHEHRITSNNIQIHVKGDTWHISHANGI